MFQLSDGQVGEIESDKVEAHRRRLSRWLSSRKIGWDDLDDKAKAAFLDMNENRAVAYDITSENARAQLAYAFFWSGDPEAFEARDDVQEVLTAGDLPAYGKVRRLHAIAYDIVHGSSLFTKEKPPADKTFTPATVIQFGEGV